MSLPSVEQFKNQMALGGARANYFLVSGPIVGGADFTYLCRAASLPAATVNTVEVSTPGGRKLKLAGERTFEDWSITVYNDTQMIMRRRFESWQAQCAQYGNPLGADALDAYGQSNWVVTQLSRSGAPVRSYQFFNMWPSSLAAIDLNFDDAGSIEEFEVTLSYSHYEPTGSSLNQIDSAVELAISTALSTGNISFALTGLANLNAGTAYLGGAAPTT